MRRAGDRRSHTRAGLFTDRITAGLLRLIVNELPGMRVDRCQLLQQIKSNHDTRQPRRGLRKNERRLRVQLRMPYQCIHQNRIDQCSGWIDQHHRVRRQFWSQLHQPRRMKPAIKLAGLHQSAAPTVGPPPCRADTIHRRHRAARSLGQDIHFLIPGDRLYFGELILPAENGGMTN